MDAPPVDCQPDAPLESEKDANATDTAFRTYARLSAADRDCLQRLVDLPPLGSLPVAEERARMRAGQATGAGVYPVSIEVCQTTACPVHIIRPVHLAAQAPVLFYLHGGGWVLGDIETHRSFVCELALKTRCVVAFVEYPCAPEHVFPASIDASITAITEILSVADTLRIDSTRFVIAGDSAGGNLTTAVILERVKRGLPLPARQILLWPVMDRDDATGSYRQFEENPNLSRAAMHWFWSQYLPGAAVSNDPRAAPLRSERADLAKFPPTLLITCEYDVLRDEGESFAARLVQAGADVTAIRWLGSLHGFVVNESMRRSQSAQTCLETVAQYIRCALGEAD